MGGKPLIDREYGRGDRLQKRDRSLRKFQSFLGMSYSYKDSGKKSVKKFHGSSMVRSHPFVINKAIAMGTATIKL